MNNKKTLNLPIIIAYTVLLAGLAIVIELVLEAIPVPEGLVSIGQGLAETGFSVAVIAVSILAVITNISESSLFWDNGRGISEIQKEETRTGVFMMYLL